MNSLVTNNNKPTLTGTANPGPQATTISSVTLVVNGQDLTATVNPFTLAWTATVGTALADGTYDVQVTATDNDNHSTTRTVTGVLVIDTEAPSATVNSLVADTGQPTLTGTVTDPSPSSGIASVAVAVNGQNLTATVNGTSWSATVATALVPGTYNVQVTATDKAGNTASSTATGALTVQRRHHAARQQGGRYGRHRLLHGRQLHGGRYHPVVREHGQRRYEAQRRRRL